MRRAPRSTAGTRTTDTARAFALLRERGLDLSRYGGHVGTARELRLEHAHYLAHVLRTGGAGLRDGGLHLGNDFRLGHLLGHVCGKNGQLRLFLVGEIGAARAFELADRVLALLDHLVDD